MSNLCGITRLLGNIEYVCIEPEHDGELHYFIPVDAPIPYEVTC